MCLFFLKFPIHFCFCKMHHCVFRIKDASEIIRVINSFQMRSLKNLASDFAHFLIMMATSSFQAQSSWYITISVATCSVSVKIFFVSQIFDNDHIFFKHSCITLFILFGAERPWYFQSGLYVTFLRCTPHQMGHHSKYFYNLTLWFMAPGEVLAPLGGRMVGWFSPNTLECFRN